MGNMAEIPTIRASQQISIAQLETFLAAASSDSFSHAARSLAVSQPSLSRDIRLVEQAL